ncbi:hypothetical protein FA15DRAFT_710025 [Coprinopsis marcescibilis]|uniref:Uncharacterized protein n=1 Tax=Coprinopsis marcescibilis TaxID=230819 RepID=A0A5C3KDW0_COPMA|nr:hypothetical protein FA15DRAFT_710025 [Coprinopsis marcescibilis]
MASQKIVKPIATHLELVISDSLGELASLNKVSWISPVFRQRHHRKALLFWRLGLYFPISKDKSTDGLKLLTSIGSNLEAQSQEIQVDVDNGALGSGMEPLAELKLQVCLYLWLSNAPAVVFPLCIQRGSQAIQAGISSAIKVFYASATKPEALVLKTYAPKEPEGKLHFAGTEMDVSGIIWLKLPLSVSPDSLLANQLQRACRYNLREVKLEMQNGGSSYASVHTSLNFSPLKNLRKVTFLIRNHDCDGSETDRMAKDLALLTQLVKSIPDSAPLKTIHIHVVHIWPVTGRKRGPLSAFYEELWEEWEQIFNVMFNSNRLPNLSHLALDVYPPETYALIDLGSFLRLFPRPQHMCHSISAFCGLSRRQSENRIKLNVTWVLYLTFITHAYRYVGLDLPLYSRQSPNGTDPEMGQSLSPAQHTVFLSNLLCSSAVY